MKKTPKACPGCERRLYRYHTRGRGGEELVNLKCRNNSCKYFNHPFMEKDITNIFKAEGETMTKICPNCGKAVQEENDHYVDGYTVLDFEGWRCAPNNKKKKAHLKFQKCKDHYLILKSNGTLLGQIYLDNNWGEFVSSCFDDVRFSESCHIEIAKFLQKLNKKVELDIEKIEGSPIEHIQQYFNKKKDNKKSPLSKNNRTCVECGDKCPCQWVPLRRAWLCEKCLEPESPEW